MASELSLMKPDSWITRCNADHAASISFPHPWYPAARAQASSPTLLQSLSMSTAPKSPPFSLSFKSAR